MIAPCQWPSDALNVLMNLRKGAQTRYEQSVLLRREYQEGDGADDTILIDGEHLANLVRLQLSAGKVLRSIDSLIDELSVVESQETRLGSVS